MMKSLSCVLLLFVCNVIHSTNCCLKNGERDLIDFVKQQLLIGCKDVRKNIDSYIQKPIDILKKEAVGKKIKIDILNFTFKVVDDEYIKNSFSLGVKSDDKESKKSKNEKKLEEVICSFHRDYFFNTDDNLNFLIYVLIEDMYCNYGGYIIKVPILFLCKIEMSELVEEMYDSDNKIKKFSKMFFGDIIADKVVNKCYFIGKTNIIDVNMDYLDEGDDKPMPPSAKSLLTYSNINLKKRNEFLDSKKNINSQALNVNDINELFLDKNKEIFEERDMYKKFSPNYQVAETTC